MKIKFKLKVSGLRRGEKKGDMKYIFIKSLFTVMPKNQHFYFFYLFFAKKYVFEDVLELSERVP